MVSVDLLDVGLMSMSSLKRSKTQSESLFTRAERVRCTKESWVGWSEDWRHRLTQKVEQGSSAKPLLSLT